VRVVLLSQSETDKFAEHVTERSKPHDVSLKVAAAAAAALLDDSNYVWDATTGEYPFFVARFIFSRGSVSFSVDVSPSSYIRVGQNAKRVGSGLFRTSHPAIGRLARSVFPSDKQLKACWLDDWTPK
jgi:hypothetical protein